MYLLRKYSYHCGKNMILTEGGTIKINHFLFLFY